MKLTLVVLVIFSLAVVVKNTTDESILFEEFTKKYKRNYFGREKDKRFQIFQNNLRTIETLNEEYSPTTIYGIGKFTDLTVEEFLEQQTCLDAPGMGPNCGQWPPDSNEKVVNKAPTPIDWREKGAVTPVKSQGNCGSCWAFSAVGNLEGANAIKTGELIDLSEQQMLDWLSVIEVGGIESEEDYPYVAYGHKTCNFTKEKSKANFTKCYDIKHESGIDVQIEKQVCLINLTPLAGIYYY